MNRRIPVDQRVAIRRERLAERDGRIELPPVLIEVDYSQSIGPLYGSTICGDLSVQNTQQSRFAATVGPHQSDAPAGPQGEIEIAKQWPAAKLLCQAARLEQILRAAAGCGEVDLCGPCLAPRVH